MTTTSISELVKQIRAFDRWDGHNYERGFGTAQHCQLPFEAADALEALTRSIPTDAAVERALAIFDGGMVKVPNTSGGYTVYYRPKEAMRAALTASIPDAAPDPFAWVDGLKWHNLGHRAVLASVQLGGWLSAALDDPKVCDAMKADIREWFSAGEPMEILGQAATHFAEALTTTEVGKVVAWLRTMADDVGETINRTSWAATFADEIERRFLSTPDTVKGDRV